MLVGVRKGILHLYPRSGISHIWSLYHLSDVISPKPLASPTDHFYIERLWRSLQRAESVTMTFELTPFPPDGILPVRIAFERTTAFQAGGECRAPWITKNALTRRRHSSCQDRIRSEGTSIGTAEALLEESSQPWRRRFQYGGSRPDLNKSSEVPDTSSYLNSSSAHMSISSFQKVTP